MTDIINASDGLNPEQLAFKKKVLNSFTFWWFMLFKVPAGWIAGMRLRQLDEEKSLTSVPFKFLNKNPFGSIYFAVQSMAAELSTAMLVMMYIQGANPSIAFIIVDMKANFSKHAKGRSYFHCEGGGRVKEAVAKCLASPEPVTIDLTTVGKLKDGTVVSEFTFTWSMKQRSK
ncbi:MAG: DUF4442 domain-containing protein [Cyclobacteriaceae bacterium]